MDELRIKKQAYDAARYKVKREDYRRLHAEYYKANREETLQRQKARREANPDKVKAMALASYYKHRVKISEQRAQWRKANPEKVIERGAAYYRANSEKVCKRTSAYGKANRGKRSAWINAYRARKRIATIGDITDIAKVYDRRNWWQQWFAVEVDHIVPLSKGGTHEVSNLQIIYDYENNRKHAKLGYKPRVIFK